MNWDNALLSALEILPNLSAEQDSKPGKVVYFHVCNHSINLPSVSNLEGELALHGGQIHVSDCGPRERSGISDHRSTADRGLHDGTGPSDRTLDYTSRAKPGKATWQRGFRLKDEEYKANMVYLKTRLKRSTDIDCAPRM